MSRTESVCTQGKPVQYYWRQCCDGGHIDATAQMVIDAISSGTNRHLSLLQEIDCEAQVEDLLEQAKRGELKPLEHIKQVQRSPSIDMFEIRWSDISVGTKDLVTGLYGDALSVHVRLYIVELGAAWTVGLHVHEKDTRGTQEEVREMQNAEIDTAISRNQILAPRTWGIPELEGLVGIPPAKKV